MVVGVTGFEPAASSPPSQIDPGSCAGPGACACAERCIGVWTEGLTGLECWPDAAASGRRLERAGVSVRPVARPRDTAGHGVVGVGVGSGAGLASVSGGLGAATWVDAGPVVASGTTWACVLAASQEPLAGGHLCGSERASIPGVCRRGSNRPGGVGVCPAGVDRHDDPVSACAVGPCRHGGVAGPIS